MPRATVITLLTAAVTSLGACSERPTAPAKAVLSIEPAHATRSFATGLATVEWNGEARALVVSHLRNPIVAGRGYALLAMAQYGAVVAADADENDSGMLPDNGDGFGPGGRARYEALRGAVAGASAQVLAYLHASAADLDAATVRRTLEAMVVADGNTGPGAVHPQFTRGLAIGRAWGDKLVAWGMTDGFSRSFSDVQTQFALTIPTDPDHWRAAPPPTLPAGYQFPWMRPYYLTSPSQFHAATPPVYKSAEFNAAIAETRGYSILPATDPERIRQVNAARTLDLGVGTVTGLGGWDLVAEQYIAESQMDERGAAHVLAVLNTGVVDAVIGCWESKYTYFYIRPVQADPTIQVVFPTPNHPSYPSGHSCVSGAAATVLADFFPQHSADVENMKIQNGLSRLYAGIHYHFDINAGQLLGSKAGAAALDYDRAPGGILRRIP